MKKKLLTLIAVFGLGVSSWAMAPHADAVGLVPEAEAGYCLVDIAWGWGGWQRGTIVYDVAMAFTQGAMAGLGGIAGAHFGPIGAVVGGGLGAA